MKITELLLASLAGTLSFSTSFAGVIQCQAKLSQGSAPTPNPRELTIMLDYEPNGTTLKTSTAIGWNQNVIEYKVVYARFNDEFNRNLLIANNPVSTHSDLIEFTGQSTPENRMILTTMKVGQSSVLGEMAKHVTYDLSCGR